MTSRFVSFVVFGTSILLGIFLITASYQYRQGMMTGEIFQVHPDDCPDGTVDNNNSRCKDPVDHPDKPVNEPDYVLVCNSLLPSLTTVQRGQSFTFTLTGSTTKPNQTVTNGNISINGGAFVAATPIGNNRFAYTYTVPQTASGAVTIQGQVAIPQYNWTAAGASCRVTLSVQVPTPTPVPLACGATPCIKAGQPGGDNCATVNGTKLVCVTATNGQNYCSMPAYQNTCAAGNGTNMTNLCCTPPTPTPAPQACGYTPCTPASGSTPDSCGTSNGTQLVCTTATNGQKYCSMQQYQAQCAVNPGMNGQNCCAAVLACVELNPKTPSVIRGQSVPFVCNTSGSATSAHFQVIKSGTTTVVWPTPGSSEISMPVSNNQATWNYTIGNLDAGSYVVQCKACNGNSCTQWGQAQQISL